jgi:hypothetical protein
MTRDEIYDHLAQVYLGKKKRTDKKNQRQFNVWLVINIFIATIIFGSAMYGFTAFLTHRGESLKDKIIYSLNRSPIRIKYNIDYPYPPVETFLLSIPDFGAEKYSALEFSVRGLAEGYPGIIRVEVRNAKREISSVMIDDVRLKWKNHRIPLEKFRQISDWSQVTDISFIIESWNAEKKKGIVLIDDVCFSS